MKKVLYRITVILLSVFVAIFSLVTVAVFVMMIASVETEKQARVLPSYEKEDISDMIEKEIWTDEDYELLYLQTGVGRSALDALKPTPQKLLEFQEALFYEGTVKHGSAAFTTPRDMLDKMLPIVPLEDGDVLISSACHTFGWRNGHAAIVVNGTSGVTLESVSLGIDSDIGSSYWFRNCSNFMVLRLKDADAEHRAEIAEWALANLRYVPYDLTVGIFSPKDKGDDIQGTHCSHLVWQAYKHFGYDIDADGGPVCTSRDISMSPLFEVVQVNGFDPVKLW